MRLCADENVPGDAVRRLRERGHDVWWISETSPGLEDRMVLERAQTEQRILLTFDKDFGHLVYYRRLPATGVILFRISQPSAAAVAEILCRVLGSRDDWAGHFSVVDDQAIRQRPLL